MRLVVREARSMGFPSSLALAVARAESNFDAYAISHKGARGLMQIMPRTANGRKPAFLRAGAHAARVIEHRAGEGFAILTPALDLNRPDSTGAFRQHFIRDDLCQCF